MPVKPGGVTSSIHLTVLDVVDVFKQPSVAVNVLVIERLHPVLTTLPSDDVIFVIVPHASVAVAVPRAGVAGHSMVVAAGTEVNTGAVLSSTVIVCDAVAV